MVKFVGNWRLRNEATHYAGSTGIPGPLRNQGSRITRQAGREGSAVTQFRLGGSKSHSFLTGQTPVLRYNRQLLQAILHDRIPIAVVVSAKVISLEEAPKGLPILIRARQ